jgi:hypothetical protein
MNAGRPGGRRRSTLESEPGTAYSIGVQETIPHPRRRTPGRRSTLRAAALLAGPLLLLSPARPVTAQQPPAATAKAPRGLEKLKGRWLRDSGGYVIEIRGVGPGGKLDAAYFNPNPIRVGKAEASAPGGVPQVVVELRDVNYPGSTYTLSYDAKTDRLVGRYYQAVARETFPVYFMRMP